MAEQNERPEFEGIEGAALVRKKDGTTWFLNIAECKDDIAFFKEIIRVLQRRVDLTEALWPDERGDHAGPK